MVHDGGGLNEILRVLPGGRFAVIAGNGKAGFCGDGRPAVSACLNDPGGIAVARSGTLYFADMGNNRRWAVSPSGGISTVAGTGRWGGWVASGTPALRAALGDPSDVTLGPGDALYITNAGFRTGTSALGSGGGYSGPWEGLWRRR